MGKTIDIKPALKEQESKRMVADVAISLIGLTAAGLALFAAKEIKNRYDVGDSPVTSPLKQAIIQSIGELTSKATNLVLNLLELDEQKKA